MAGITLAQAESKLSDWLDAEGKVAEGQSVQFGDRTLTRADLGEIRKTIEYWDRKVRRLTRGGIRVRGATPT